MADEARFAYRVQLPDGSEVIRTGGAAQPPTMGQLADYAANKGERFLGPVAMTPAPSEPPPAATAAPPPVPSETPGPVLPSAVAPTGGTAPSPPPAPPLAAAAAPQPGIGTSLVNTFLPERTFTSELPSIGGGLLAGTVTGMVPGMGWGVVPATGMGSALGEAGQVGLENVMGWPPAEPGTLPERMRRAYARGAAGEIVTAPVRAGVKYAVGAVKPLLKAAEELEPVLARTVPADATVARVTGTGIADLAAENVPIDKLLKTPALLTNLSPEAQPMVLARWWQTASEGGAKNVVKAWDALGEAGQQAIGGPQHEALTTMVESLRSTTGVPLLQMTKGEIARASLPATALTYAGHPYLAAALPLASEITREQAPRMLLYPPARTFLAGLPAKGRAVAAPADFLLRTAGQAGAGTTADMTRFR